MRRTASEVIRNLEMRIARLEKKYDTSYADEDAKQLTEALKRGIDSNRVAFKGQRTQEAPARGNRDAMKLVEVHFEYSRASEFALGKVRTLTVKQMKNLTRGTVRLEIAVDNDGNSRDFDTVRDIQGAIKEANHFLSHPKVNAKVPSKR